MTADRLIDALVELAKCDGSLSNVKDAETLAARVRAHANAALAEVSGRHLGDPCTKCGTAHDDVAPGPCRVRPADLQDGILIAPPAVIRVCRFCHRDARPPNGECRSSREMEEANSRECFDALMRAGGGEYSINREEAARRDAVFAELRSSW